MKSRRSRLKPSPCSTPASKVLSSPLCFRLRETTRFFLSSASGRAVTLYGAESSRAARAPSRVLAASGRRAEPSRAGQSAAYQSKAAAPPRRRAAPRHAAGGHRPAWPCPARTPWRVQPNLRSPGGRPLPYLAWATAGPVAGRGGGERPARPWRGAGRSRALQGGGSFYLLAFSDDCHYWAAAAATAAPRHAAGLSTGNAQAGPREALSVLTVFGANPAAEGPAGVGWGAEGRFGPVS